MKDLSDNQIAFAEWLALSPLERGTQKDMAARLGVTRLTLNLWEKIPQVHELVLQIYAKKLIALVGPATELLEKAIKKPDSVSRVSYDCARFIVKDWGDKYQQAQPIVKSISDMYRKYHPGE